MQLFRQLELDLVSARAILLDHESPFAQRAPIINRQAHRLRSGINGSGALVVQSQLGRDSALESLADNLMRCLGADRIASQLRVEWNPRLKSCAGRADYKAKLIVLNPLLRDYGREEINRTFLHELAHILAQFRAGRRRIQPHGQEWRRACHDLGIGDEKRCHNLPFPVRQRTRRYLYRCPNCRRDFARVKRIRRAVACLACCRAHNKGEFDSRFKLRLTTGSDAV